MAAGATKIPAITRYDKIERDRVARLIFIGAIQQNLAPNPSQTQAPPIPMQITSSKLRHGLSLVFVYALTASNGPAELPPSAYRERQQNAPEVLVIKVRS